MKEIKFYNGITIKYYHMVLFEFEKIIKDKYLHYSNLNPEKILNIDPIQFRQKGIEQISKIFPFYFTGINQNYLDNILADNKNQIIFSCIDCKFSLSNITSILIHHKTKSTDIIKYYILLLGTHERFRKFGYGKIILDEFIHWIKISKISKKLEIKKKILLKSLESSMGFYLSIGFVQAELKSNKLFYKYETDNELKSNPEKILELVL